ncbi:acylneuraminate cytidylyltransferase family protein [Candidatus Woesearchaeota archaeon]|nr:acylneuraminate cytidylyltransferase family protein [Candidatus Woesearchaeota archaeon]
MGNKYVVAIIPARGGSKGVPGKNIKLLDGKPLITYAIEASLKSKVFNDVIVSTDSEEIANIARKFGASVPFLRPAHLATDIAHTPPVIEHAVSFLEQSKGIKVDVVVTLQCTTPLTTASHIKEAYEKFMSGNFDSLISVKRAFPPYWMFVEKNDLGVPLIELDDGRDAYNLERQQLPSVYQANGAFWFTKRDKLKEKNNIVIKENNAIYEMDEFSSLDIDTEVDFFVIEQHLKKLKLL